MRLISTALTFGVAFAGCAGERWPEPTPVDPAQYQRDYEQWRQDQQQSANVSLSIVGIWPVPQGTTAFGSDGTLPIVLPAPAPVRTGVLTLVGDAVTVTPASGTALMFEGGGTVPPNAPLGLYETTLALDSLRLQLVDMGDESPQRLYLAALDQSRPASVMPIETYPVDQRWRVPARFAPFAAPKPVQVQDVRGGTVDYLALGQLVFRIDGSEHRLTAFGEPGAPQLFVMFRDRTNGSTTYGGFRMLSPKAAPDGWTVLDFNVASNPPCAYSRFTTCPLPPPENRLDAAIAAGEKRHPAAQGFAG